jgi:hypothetical protein
MRFSLRSLVLVVALLGAVLSHVVTSFELHRVRQESRRLRDELGYLSISDERELHAIALASDLGYVSKRWKWRLYFPAGRQFRVCYKFDELPAEGIPNDQYEFFDDVEEELTFTVSAVPDLDGVWKLVLHTEPVDFRFSQTRSQTIANAAWLTDDSSMGWFQAGEHTTESVHVGDSMVLLRIRPTKPLGTIGGAPASTPDPDLADGIMVWIEEVMSHPLKESSA